MCEYKEGKLTKGYPIDKKSIGDGKIYEHRRIEPTKIHIPSEHKIADDD